MRVKTFRGPNTSAVFARVKAEMGDEAIILSNKTVDNNGKKSCEVMAAVDPTGATTTSRPAKAQPKKPSVDDLLTEPIGDIPRWAQEWGEIKNHLIALMKPQMNMDTLSPRQKLAMEFLEREGVDNQVLTKVFIKLSENKTQSILPVLNEITRVKAFNNNNWPEKFHIFAGPHGSGKTSTMIRLALREKKHSPASRICLVCADRGQGKGRMILKHYAELSGIEYREIITRDDARELLEESRNFDRVYIDLPGMTGKTKLNEWLGISGLNAYSDSAVHLVLNPFYERKQYDLFLEKYNSERLSSIIWTKLDEACTFGAVINTAYLNDLPVSALSYGSGLRNSLTQAKADLLWRMIFKHELPGTDRCTGKKDQ
ncbi:MAG: flagellar biosynthesis protein FlhF [Desulfovibrio sp.]